jgi:outer membrane protein TolC
VRTFVQSILLTAGTLLLLVTGASAQDQTTALSLDDAVRLALERNLDIRVERLTPQLFDYSLAGLQSIYEPVFTSQIATQSTVTPSTSTIAGAAAASGITQGLSTFNAGLTQNLRWGGGGLTVLANNNRQTTTSRTTLFNPTYNTNYSVQYTQPLLRGFRTDATRTQIEITRLNQQISQLDLEATITNTVSDVRNAYWDLVYATESVEVARQSLDIAQQLVSDNQARVDVGTLAPLELVAAQSQAATQRQALVQAEATRDQAEIALKELIVSGTGDGNWDVTLVPSDRPTFSPEPIDIPALVQRARGERTDLAAAQRSLEASERTLSYLRNQLLPQIDLVARYGLVGLGGTQYIRSGTGISGDIIGTTPGGYGDSLSSLFGLNYPAWSTAINVTMPLGRGQAKANVARGRVQLEQARTQIAQLELRVASDITNAGKTAQSAAQAVDAARSAETLAQQALNAEQERFRVGLSTNFNVIQSQRDLAAARNAELQAVLTYRKALVEIDRLSKSSLQRANITVVGTNAG